MWDELYGIYLWRALIHINELGEPDATFWVTTRQISDHSRPACVEMETTITSGFCGTGTTFVLL